MFLHGELLPKKFDRGKKVKKRSSNGNLVNGGNFDTNGVNVNNWNPDNSNPNIGVCASRQSYHLKSPLQKGGLLFRARKLAFIP